MPGPLGPIGKASPIPCPLTLFIDQGVAPIPYRHGCALDTGRPSVGPACWIRASPTPISGNPSPHSPPCAVLSRTSHTRTTDAMVDVVLMATMLPGAWEDDQELHRRHLLHLRASYRAGLPHTFISAVIFAATVVDRRRRSGRTKASPAPLNITTTSM